jgi:hypothetical protein
MKITDALKKDESLRVTNFDKWMIFDQQRKEWVVLKLQRGEDEATEEISTEHEEIAVDVLMRL